MCIYSNANSYCQCVKEAQGNNLCFGMDCAFLALFSGHARIWLTNVALSLLVCQLVRCLGVLDMRELNKNILETRVLTCELT
jgi:hypothetical protein